MVSARDQRLNPDLASRALTGALMSPAGTLNHAVTLRLEDWALWRVRAREVESLYRQSRAWPNLLFGDGWVLESPPSSLDCYLYPAGPAV